MNSKTTKIFSLAIILITAVSCTNQRFVSGETDDIYYSSSDRYAEDAEDHNNVKEIKGDDYKESSQSTSGYYSIGRETNSSDQNQRAEGAYSDFEEMPANNSIVDENGTTINNFYGNTTYNDGEYFDDSYANRLRRFNNTNVAIGYYDPFFVDPFWNYGWGWNNGWGYGRPYSGWSVGFNSWGGWNAGYNWGWGQPRWGWGQPGWGYNSWCGWNDPFFYNNCYGPYGFNRWGGGWNNGYAYGYQNGFSDGFYNGGGFNQSPSRRTYRGKAPVAGNNGFSDQVVNSNRSSRDRVYGEQPKVNGQTRNGQTTASDGNSSQLATTERLDRSNNIYQTNPRRDVVNQNSESAANRYNSTDRSNARNKYLVESVEKSIVNDRSNGTQRAVDRNQSTSSTQKNYPANDRSTYSGNNRATYGDSRTNSRTQTSKAASSSQRNGDSYTRPQTRTSTNTSTRATAPNRSNGVNNRTAPSQTRTNASSSSHYRNRTSTSSRSNSTTNQRSRTAPTRTAPSRTAPSRQQSAPQRTSPNSRSRSYSSPQRSAPSRMSSPSPSRSSSSRSSSSSSSSRSGGRR